MTGIGLGPTNYVCSDGGGGWGYEDIATVVDKFDQMMERKAADPEYIKSIYRNVHNIDIQKQDRIILSLTDGRSNGVMFLQQKLASITNSLSKTNSNAFFWGEGPQYYMDNLSQAISDAFRLLQKLQSYESEIGIKMNKYNMCLEKLRNGSQTDGVGGNGGGNQNSAHNTNLSSLS